jgi:hypothetical protein
MIGDIRSMVIRQRTGILELHDRFSECTRTRATRGVLIDPSVIDEHPMIVSIAHALRLGEVSSIISSSSGLHLLQKIYDGHGYIAASPSETFKIASVQHPYEEYLDSPQLAMETYENEVY